MGNFDLVLIASSTGGPSALDKVLSNLSKDFDVPILIVQHMPANFTQMLADSLNKKCALEVREAKDGDIIGEKGIIIAKGGLHMIVVEERGKKIIRLIDAKSVNGVKPAADVLFDSVAQSYTNKRILAAVLTGMGSDGKVGVKKLKDNCKCYCITQSPDSCVVYGMPKSVHNAGLSDEVVDIELMGHRMESLITG